MDKAIYGKRKQMELLSWAAAAAKSLQSCPTLCDPMDCGPLGYSVHGILQARIPEWVAMPSSRGSSQLRDRNLSLISPALAGGFFTVRATWEAPFSRESTDFLSKVFNNPEVASLTPSCHSGKNKESLKSESGNNNERNMNYSFHSKIRK